MSITKKQFLKGNFKQKPTNRKNHKIAIFLKSKKSQAFTANEIKSAVKMNGFTIRSMLRKLEKDGLILHKAPYFIWK